MFNDSYQYLSVARNLLEGNGLSTSLLYFDEHLATGRIPAPQTVFPPGYPVAVAALGALGVPLEAAGVAVSVVSYLATLALFAAAGRLLRVPGLALALLLALLAANEGGWVYALSVGSESLFTAVSLGALVALLKAETTDGGPAAVGWGAALAGLACWVRYAGLFLVAAAGLYYALKLVRRRTRRALRDLLLFGGISLALAGVLLGRNVLITGSLRGGNTRPHDRPAAEALHDVWQSVAGTLWGDHADDREGLLPGGIGTPGQVTVAVLALLGAWALARPRSVLAGLRRPAALLLLAYLVVYTAALFYCARFTSVTVGEPRMFYPLLPPALVLAGAAFARGEAAPAPGRLRATAAAVLLLAGAGYLAAQVHSACLSVAEYEADTAEPAQAAPAGESLAAVVNRLIGPDEVVVANDGQTFGYYFDRKTVGLASLHYSREPWTEGRLRRVVAAYGARFLVLFPDGGDFQVLAGESPFLRALVREDRLPAWITPAARTAGCRIYRLDPGRPGG